MRISGGAFLDYYAAVAATRTIVSAEKILPTAQMEKTREENTIPGDVVDAIVEIPFGGHPTAVHACYDNDPWWFRTYIEASKTRSTMAAWLAEWIHGLAGFDAYLEKVGLDRLATLTADESCGYAPHIQRRLDRL